MNVRNVPIKCTQCGQPNVRPKTYITERNGKEVHEFKWICHRCGMLVKKHTESQ